MTLPHIRPATLEDAPALAELLAELGHAASDDEAASRLERLHAGDESRIYVAEDAGRILGVIGLHVMPLLHRAAPMGRITVLVVREEARGRGVGRRLVEQAAQVLREQGCGMVEVTSNLRRADAHAFYRKMGFETPSAYFRRPL